jgi:hypothetical protein
MTKAAIVYLKSPESNGPPLAAFAVARCIATSSPDVIRISKSLN